ncbi:MAG TPA: PAS domain S-box protein [Opitutaceae bacterium]|nr:PAS domain S-box protein [Opitutaceae bacterium]
MGTIWLGSVFIAVPILTFSFFGIVDIALLAAIWVAACAPLSDRTRFAVIQVGCFGASTNAILLYGTTPGVPVLLGIAVLIAAIYYDWKGGLAAGGASLLLVGVGAWGWHSGLMPLGPQVPRLSPTGYDFWIRTVFAQILSVSAITGTVHYILRELRTILLRSRLAEEKFAKAFRTCPDAMAITELESGRIIEVNDSHERLTGYTREEALGRTSVDLGMFKSAQDREAFAAPLRAMGTVHRLECRVLDRAGRPVDVLFSAECFALGGLKCVLTIIQDISERKRTETALQANEERLRSFIENSTVGIYRSTPEGRIILANPAIVRIMGYESFQELTSRNIEIDCLEASYPRQEFRERIEKAGQLRGWEAKWKRRDGTTIFVRETANVVRGPDGQVQYYDGIIEDISDRKKAEQALRESEERFRNLTAAAFEGIVISEKGRVIDINDQGLKLFGCERREMIGRDILDFIGPESRQVVAESIRTNREVAYEHQLLRKDGSRFYAEAQAKMMRMGDRMVRMTALRDITERRQAEQRQKNLEEQIRHMQKMEALGTLAGGIAHDFNNILTGILGNLQLAEMDLPSGHPASGALRSADKASWRARDLIARILSFSRLDRDNRAPAALAPVVIEAVQLLRVGLPGQVEIRTEIDTNCPLVVFDPGQIHQVIMNLGTNSALSMHDRRGELTVELHPVTPGEALCERHPQVTSGHKVCLTLRDNGDGMDEAVLKRIFEPFYTTKALGHGTGLGLAMVHAIMKSHNGAIVVKSAPGSGTTFDLYFPVAAEKVPETKSGALPARQDQLIRFGNNRRIMLVDDEEPIRVIGAELLERLGFSPLTYTRPTEALEAFTAEPASFSAVISDLTMPEMTGLELARHILAIRSDTPIILTSGYLHSDAQQKARESGVRCVINKPFEMREMVEQIRFVLGESSGRGA